MNTNITTPMAAGSARARARGAGGIPSLSAAFRLLLIGPLIIVLAALSLRDGVLGAAREADPPRAAALDPQDPLMLAIMADAALPKITRPGVARLILSEARAAIAREPLRLDALRDIGLVQDLGGDHVAAHRAIALVGQLTPLDAVAHVWLAEDGLEAGHTASGLVHLDAALRISPQILPALAPLVIDLARTSPDAFAARLAQNPPWRTDALQLLAARSPNSAIDFAVLSGLARTSSPPTEPELSPFFDRRLAEDHADQQAYLDWLQLLPPQGLAHATSLYDGDFTGLPGPPPFNWRLGAGAGGDALRGVAPDGHSALDVTYDGFANPFLAEQLLTLGPGVWRLSGSVQTRDASDPALRWRVVCAEGKAGLLGEAAMPASQGAWSPFQLSFTVPAEGCGAQWLRLTPTPGDHERSIEAWFRALEVRSGPSAVDPAR